MSDQKIPTLFGLMKQWDGEAESLRKSGKAHEANRAEQDAARIRAWAKEACLWYLEPHKETEPERDYARHTLAEELVTALGETKAEAIAAKLQRMAARYGDDGQFGQMAAASEIRKAIMMRRDEDAEELARTA